MEQVYVDARPVEVVAGAVGDGGDLGAGVRVLPSRQAWMADGDVA